jgi:hypothetical protein
MLRASAAANNIPVDLSAIADSSIDSGIENGNALLAFADAVTGPDHAVIIAARAELLERMGAGALVQSAAIAANFSMNDRAANAIGIPMEAMFLDGSEDYRASLGLNKFPSARNTLGN